MDKIPQKQLDDFNDLIRTGVVAHKCAKAIREGTEMPWCHVCSKDLK